MIHLNISQACTVEVVEAAAVDAVEEDEEERKRIPRNFMISWEYRKRLLRLKSKKLSKSLH